MNSFGPFIAAGAFVALSGVFNVYAPVTYGMRFEETSRAGAVVGGRVLGRKIKDCAVVKGSFVGWQKVGAIWYETPFQFIADDTPDSTRPNGWALQDFGIWQWSNVSAGASDVKMTLQHNCSGNLTVTQASFKIPATSQ